MAADANPELGRRHVLGFYPSVWTFGVQGEQDLPESRAMRVIVTVPPAVGSPNYQPGLRGSHSLPPRDSLLHLSLRCSVK